MYACTDRWIFIIDGTGAVARIDTVLGTESQLEAHEGLLTLNWATRGRDRWGMRRAG